MVQGNAAAAACARRLLGIIKAIIRAGLTWPPTTVGQGHVLPAPP
jgi:hypothetical protein